MSPVHRSVLVLAVLIAFGGVVPALAEDADGVQEHPMIERYPGQSIAWQEIENFMPYKVPAGPVTGYRTIDNMIETAGRVTRTFYLYEGTDRTHSEIWKNYSDGLKAAGFEILGEGTPTTRAAKNEIGGRGWLQVALTANPWGERGAPVDLMVTGSATQGDSGAIIAKKDRAAGTAYVVLTVERHSADIVGTLIDIIEVEAAETGLVAVNAEAMGSDIAEYGRVVLDGIVFDFDKATLRPESDAALSAIAEYLAANSAKNFYVVGHTDSVGPFAYNQKLSADRARAVVEALKTSHGVTAGRLEPHGIGPLSPVFSNGSDAGRDQNRRVELVERQQNK